MPITRYQRLSEVAARAQGASENRPIKISLALDVQRWDWLEPSLMQLSAAPDAAGGASEAKRSRHDLAGGARGGPPHKGFASRCPITEAQA